MTVAEDQAALAAPGTVSRAGLSGLLSAPLTITMALAPFAGAALAALLGGQPAMFLAVAALALAAAALALTTDPRSSTA